MKHYHLPNSLVLQMKPIRLFDLFFSSLIFLLFFKNNYLSFLS